MRRRFLISMNEEPQASVAKMIALLNAMGDSIAWWHYIKGTWLVVDPKGEITAEQIRNRIREAFPDVNHMVFEVPLGGTWNGFGPPKMQKWLEESWDKLE